MMNFIKALFIKLFFNPNIDSCINLVKMITRFHKIKSSIVRFETLNINDSEYKFYSSVTFCFNGTNYFVYLSNGTDSIIVDKYTKIINENGRTI